MYLLDTNVISELRKTEAQGVDKNLLAWAKSVSPDKLFLSVITILELEKGILLVERRDKQKGEILRKWMTRHVLPTFSDKIISVDLSVALKCATLHVPDPRPDRDAIIMATALVHNMIIVTRNIKDFRGLEIEVINPWST
ncbi:MAG: type II toxin-antitoxin system VapC family toxin [Pseudomonadota bacterium]